MTSHWPFSCSRRYWLRWSILSVFSSLSGMKVGAQSSAVNEAEADVVVVGYGAAGAAAAIEAAKAGAKVIILEKAPQKTHCSTTRLSSGIYLSPDAAIDKEVLKDYIVSTYLRDGAELRRQGRLPAPLGDLAEVWATLAPETFAWLQSLDPDFRSATPPLYTRSQFVNLWHGVKPHIQAQVATYSLWRDFYQSTYRAPKSETLNGEALYACLAAGIEAHAVPVHYGERAVALEVQNGIVCGVWAQSDKGRTLYRARLGVILASGGFAFNRALRQALLPREANDYWAVSSSPENTGDGLALGLSQGADIVRSSAYFDRFCILLPERLHGVRLGVPMDCVGRPHTLLVDNLGRRFTSESDLQDIYQHYGYVDEMLRLDSDTHRCERTPTWCIFDEVMMKSAPIATLGEGSTVSRLVDWTTNQQALEKGWILRGDTIEVLAAKIAAHPDNAQRMSAAVLQNTLNTFNDYALRRLDTDFDRAPATMRPLSEGPYYAVPVSIDVPHMAAGLRTDARRAVVRRDGQPIPGLFAAGEVAPVSRLMHDKGGHLSECLVFGRYVGRIVAQQPPLSQEVQHG